MRIIYLVKSDFLVPQDEYYMVFWGAEQILFNEKKLFIRQKMEMLQNLKYVIFTVKMLLKKGHSTSKNLTIFYCSIHGLFKNHPIFEINHMSDGSFENFVIFRPLIINFFCFDQIQKFFEANIFYHGKGCYAQWASNSVKKCLP